MLTGVKDLYPIWRDSEYWKAQQQGVTFLEQNTSTPKNLKKTGFKPNKGLTAWS